MTAKLDVLLDANVILDVLQKREPFYATSARVLALAETGQIHACIAAHTATTIFYLIAKNYSVEQARTALTDLLQILSVATVDQATVMQALALPYRDFEDAVQMVAAIRAGARYLVTRNVGDFKAGPLPVLQPVELLAIV